jgi:hypothetical protein
MIGNPNINNAISENVISKSLLILYTVSHFNSTQRTGLCGAWDFKAPNFHLPT